MSNKAPITPSVYIVFTTVFKDVFEVELKYFKQTCKTSFAAEIWKLQRIKAAANACLSESHHDKDRLTQLMRTMIKKNIPYLTDDEDNAGYIKSENKENPDPTDILKELDFKIMFTELYVEMGRKALKIDYSDHDGKKHIEEQYEIFQTNYPLETLTVGPVYGNAFEYRDNIVKLMKLYLNTHTFTIPIHRDKRKGRIWVPRGKKTAGTKPAIVIDDDNVSIKMEDDNDVEIQSSPKRKYHKRARETVTNVNEIRCHITKQLKALRDFMVLHNINDLRQVIKPEYID